MFCELLQIAPPSPSHDAAHLSNCGVDAAICTAQFTACFELGLGNHKSSRSPIAAPGAPAGVLVWSLVIAPGAATLGASSHPFGGILLDRISLTNSHRSSINVPIHFVLPETRDDGAASWLLSTRKALERPLAERAVETTLGPALLPGAINLATPASLSSLFRPYYRSFMVGLRTEGAQLAQCDWEIIGVGLDGLRARRSVIGPWTSSKVQARDANRQGLLASMVFLTHSPATTRWRNLAAQSGLLASLGVSCRFEAPTLCDFSNIDILVADCAELRQGGGFINPQIAAWRAGIPAILIDTELERSERASALDYLAITGPEQLIETLQQLQSHAQLYEAMRQRAAEKARGLCDKRIIEHWIEILSDVIAPVAQRVLHERQSRPVRALSLQTGRWLMQQGQRAGHSLARQARKPASGASAVRVTPGT